jgi:hypothetical protein
MAGVGQGATIEENQAEDAEASSAIRIDTDVFATLTATAGGEDDDGSAILRWFDCWRP